MESVKKWLTERTNKKNGLYVHYSPPKLLGGVSPAQLRQWARGGAEGRLEKAVLAGQGRRLLAETEPLPLAHHLPTLIAKCDALHTAVERGSLLELQVLLELLDSDYNRRKYITCRDEAGVGLLHKAIYYDYMDIATWLVKQYPLLVHQKDSEGRTPLHYAAVCRDEAAAAALLEGAGASRGARDAAGRTPAHYRGPARTLLALPTATDMARETKNPPGLVIKGHNIRIWCHDCDMARLQRVVWEGHGTRLLSEVSNQPIVKRFLEAVPYIMNTIREIHTTVVQNDLEGLMKHSGDPVPPQALSSRDNNNMTVMHKAAGLGHGGILKYIADRYPQGINDIDNDGRTPLHYAATVRDEKHTYNTLVSLGADESAVDNKNKTPGYYINRPQDIDKNLLRTIPEAPRTASSAYPSSWDWKLLDTEVIAELNKKSRRKNLKASNENISSKNNTNTVSESTENLPNAMKMSSTREFIKGLPDLDDSNKSHGDDNVKVNNKEDNEIDPEVTELINNANMEMLATLVLNGEGSRLIGRRSGNSELQAFLDNVPTYMQKINKVHSAAREGNIRDLQAALDRRKFAIARDPISPNGATPLHVATVFGKTNIIKYLGGRFPETLSAVDFEGRTALHYAAVLPDNGHYYNLLQQLGANSKDLDDNGQSAEDYLKNPSLLPFSQLLSDYGISEEAAQDMLSDKVPEDHVSSRRSLDVPEALDTLERCYRLLASARPSRTPLSASSNKATPPIVLGRFLKRPVFEMIKYRITKLDHDLFDVIWPAVKKLPDNRNIIQTVEEDFPGGITAPDYYVYELFHEFLTPLIKDLHNINIHSDLSTHPPSDFTNTIKFSSMSSEPFVELNIDPSDELVLSGTIECSRNLEGFELPLNLKIGKLETIERILTTILMQDDFAKYSEVSNPESDQKGGTYYTLNEVLEKPSEICATLASSGLLIALCDRDEIDDCTRLHGKHWPYGRGVFVSEDKTVAIWINVHDHLRVLVSTPTDSPGEIGLPFSKLAYIMSYLHERLDFVWDLKLGHLSSRPTFLGAGLRISLIVNFPGLSKDSDNMKHLCAMRGLQYRETLSSDIARISNYQCLSTTEVNCFNDFATASSNLLQLEKDLSMQSSAQIATMLTNIFRRKRSSLGELESPEKYPKQ
ncbi:uncharacterized protein LOC113520751 isoform X4 [Galleria mellonella]|uniref:Uncharacterized protein LOC113520751 isoform X4 n=1 Tax=Galleria mellonella TaxID=7137 RepID=A0ABM3M884_GALME|nr:uncharacterized protein LOC113520751 isoform X4 [Galleria mellonella]